MTAINFGSGTAVGRRTDQANPTPSFLGILQDIQIDFDQAVKELQGQYKVAVDVAPAALKIQGKAKFARIESTTMRDLLFGSGAVVTPAAGINFVAAEGPTPIPTTPFQITASHGAAFLEDYGVFNSATGKQFTRVASAPVAGQYSVNEATGVYLFASADNVSGISVYIYYTWTSTTLVQSVISNTFMGTGPTFEMFIAETYTNNAGQLNTFNLKLNACRASKLSYPFKNADYTVQEFDFMAFADQAGVIGTICSTE